MASTPKYESTVRGKRLTPNQLATSFWDHVKADPTGTNFSPGYSGSTYLTNNVWDYITMSASPYDADTNNSLTNGKNVISPGRVTVIVSKQYARDLRKPALGQGATVAPLGIMPADIDLQFLIWTPQQWGAFQDFVFTYVPTAKQDPKAYLCSHPALKIHKVSVINIWGLIGPVDGPYPRSKVWTIKAQEWTQPSQQTITPPAPDDNIYSKYESSPSSSLTTTPGSTTSPSQPQGLQQ